MHWHTWLFDRYRSRQERHKCLRWQITPGDGIYWMEWLAGYVSGAMLMPRSRLRLHVGAFCAEQGVSGPFDLESLEGRLLIERTGELFNASAEAAAWRLRQLGHLVS